MSDDDQAERIYDEAERMVREDEDRFTRGARAESEAALRQAREDANAPSKFWSMTNADDSPEEIAEDWTTIAPVVRKASIWLPVTDVTLEWARQDAAALAWDMLKLEDYAKGYRSPFDAPFELARAPWWTIPLAYIAVIGDKLEEVGW